MAVRRNGRIERAKALIHRSATGGVALSFAFALLSIVLGLLGWSTALYDGSPRSVIEIFTRVVGSFIPSSQGSQGGNWATQSGTLFGNITTISGGIVLGLAVGREFLTRLRARYLWKGHAIVLGDTSLARSIAEAFDREGHSVLHVVPAEAPKLLPNGLTRVRSGNRNQDIADIRFASAGMIVIDVGNDAANLSLTRSVLNALAGAAGQSQQPILTVNVTDPVLADKFSELLLAEARRAASSDRPPIHRPVFFDVGIVIARDTLARHPLYRVANTRKQERVHAVVIGFGRLGEHLLDQVMLTSIAGDLGPPRVTVIDRAADQREREFRARRPSVADSLDIEFVTFDFESHPVDSDETQSLIARLERAPVTAIFVSLPTDEDVLRTSLLINRLRDTFHVLDATVFYRSRLADEDPDLLGDLMHSSYAASQFVRMRSPLAKLLDDIADPHGRDALAQALHRSYVTGSQRSAEGAMEWNQLSDSLQRANIRAADHLPAKLWSLGLNGQLVDDATGGQAIAKLQRSIEQLSSAPHAYAWLAELEHKRWMIERKLDGWTYAATRSDSKRNHPSLVEWSQLKHSQEEVAKDVRQIGAALRFALNAMKHRSAD